MSTTTKKTRVKPNTVLPKGAILITPITFQIGQWVKIEYDAKLTRKNINWYRVRGGMSERNDREDWVADIPGYCVSVHDYHWNGHPFGENHGTFSNALKQELKRVLQYGPKDIKEKEQEILVLKCGLEKVRKFLSK